MKKNKKYNVVTEHIKAKWAIRVAMVMTAVAGYFGWSEKATGHKLATSLDREIKTQKAYSTQVRSLKRKLVDAQTRMTRAEKLNRQAWSVLANTMPAYTAEVDGMDEAGEKSVAKENAKEEAIFQKNCKAMNINPVKLKALHEALRK